VFTLFVIYASSGPVMWLLRRRRVRQEPVAP